MRPILWAPLVWLILAGFYLLLAGSADVVEISAMLLCCTLGTALAVGLSTVAELHFVLRPAPRAILLPLGSLLPELLAVGRELVRAAVSAPSRHRGSFMHQPFDFGDDGPRDAGRRAVTLIGLSLAPRTFVIRAEHDAGTVLMHGLPPKPASSNTEWPA